jgi:hypothetical protein
MAVWRRDGRVGRWDRERKSRVGAWLGERVAVVDAEPSITDINVSLATVIQRRRRRRGLIQ